MEISLSDVVAAVQSKQITQAALAKEAGLTQAAISMICTGETKSPSYENALSIIAAGKKLGVVAKTDEKRSVSRDNQDSSAVKPGA